METTELTEANLEEVTQAERLSKKDMRLAILSVDHVLYDCIVTPCSCPDRSYIRAHLPKSRNHFFSKCAVHGLQDCGIAIRAQRQTAATDPQRQERRRKSGYTTKKWYEARGR